MCMIDDSDGSVTMLGRSSPRARVRHRCSECRRFIKPGETYLNERTFFDGKFVVYKTCTHCQVARKWLSDECGGWLFGGVEEDLAEHANDSFYASDVKRLYVAMRNHWTDHAGRLRPVPRVPLTSIKRRVIEGMMP